MIGQGIWVGLYQDTDEQWHMWNKLVVPIVNRQMIRVENKEEVFFWWVNNTES